MLTQQKFFAIVSTFIFSVLFSSVSFAETLIYKVTTSGKESISETIITKADNGYVVKMKNDSNKDEHICDTDLSFSLIKWKYNKPENGTDISADRSGNTISITGQFKNKKYEEKSKINELPWYQAWGLGLKAFINSDKDKTYFWSIDPNSLRIAKFEAKKMRMEKIQVSGKEIESVYVTLNLTGFLKAFWSGGEMWFRKSDGRFVYQKMNPEEPQDNMQLISEN